MASEREGRSVCFDDHRSIEARISSDNRIAVTGSLPVAGRPRPFFGNTSIDGI